MMSTESLESLEQEAAHVNLTVVDSSWSYSATPGYVRTPFGRALLHKRIGIELPPLIRKVFVDAPLSAGRMEWALRTIERMIVLGDEANDVDPTVDFPPATAIGVADIVKREMPNVAASLTQEAVLLACNAFIANLEER